MDWMLFVSDRLGVLTALCAIVPLIMGFVLGYWPLEGWGPSKVAGAAAACASPLGALMGAWLSSLLFSLIGIMTCANGCEQVSRMNNSDARSYALVMGSLLGGLFAAGAGFLFAMAGRWLGARLTSVPDRGYP